VREQHLEYGRVAGAALRVEMLDDQIEGRLAMFDPGRNSDAEPPASKPSTR
jgi:hypothetical protein